MFTDTGTLYIIDFEHAAFLPTSFMTLALSLDRPINEALRNKLSLPQENLNAMQAARYYFQISGHGVGKCFIKYLSSNILTDDHYRLASR